MNPFCLAIVGPKGGVGKTALAVSLAAHFARKNHQVWVVDLDPAAGATLALGKRPGGADLAATLGKARKPVPLHVEGTLHLLPGGPEPSALKSPRSIREVLAKAPADMVILDCPTGTSSISRLAMQSSGVILVGAEPHRLAIDPIKPVLAEILDRPRKTRCAVVLGRVDGRSGMDGVKPGELAQSLCLPVLTVHRAPRLARAMEAGIPPPSVCRAAKDVRAVAAWLEGTTQV